MSERPAALRRGLLVLAEGQQASGLDVCSVGCSSGPSCIGKREAETGDLSGLAFKRAEWKMENRGRESGSLKQPVANVCHMSISLSLLHEIRGSEPVNHC